MIKANELRVNNYFRDKETGNWDQLTEDNIEPVFYNLRCGELEGIPLTPEILDKFGFERSATKRFSVFYFKEDSGYPRYSVVLSRSHESVIKLKTISGWQRLSYLKHLHQLQNLYFALTGEELKINLKP